MKPWILHLMAPSYPLSIISFYGLIVSMVLIYQFDISYQFELTLLINNYNIFFMYQNYSSHNQNDRL